MRLNKCRITNVQSLIKEDISNTRLSYYTFDTIVTLYFNKNGKKVEYSVLQDETKTNYFKN